MKPKAQTLMRVAVERIRFCRVFPVGAWGWCWIFELKEGPLGLIRFERLHYHEGHRTSRVLLDDADQGFVLYFFYYCVEPLIGGLVAFEV
jgi:hypothetical protein